MSSAALPQPNHGTKENPALLFPLEKSRTKRLTDLDTLLRSAPFEQGGAVPNEGSPLPPPGMFTALRVCLLAHGGLLLAMAVGCEVWRATR